MTKNKKNYDVYGRRKETFGFVAEELCRLFAHLPKYEKLGSLTEFNRIVRYLLGVCLASRATKHFSGMRTKAAGEILSQEDKERANKTRYDHVVPLNLLISRMGQIAEEKTPTRWRHQFEQLLNDNLFMVLLTKEEDDCLNKQGRSEMPKGWQFGDNPFARYLAAKIDVLSSEGAKLNLRKAPWH